MTTAARRLGIWELLFVAGVCAALFIGQKVSLVVFAALLSLLLLPLAPIMLLPFFLVLVGMPVAMSEMSADIGFKVYGADIILFFFAACLLWIVIPGPWQRRLFHDRPREEWPVVLLVMLLCAYGFFSAVMGFFSGYPPNDVLGEFRRFFVYTAVMLIPLFLPIPNKMLRLLGPALAIPLLMVVGMGIYRLATGATWSEEYFMGDPDINITVQLRRLSQGEIATLGLVMGYLCARIRDSVGLPEKLLCLALAIIAAGFLIISGWRLALIYLVVTPLMALVIMAVIRGEGMGGLMRVALMLAFLALILAVAITLLAPGLTKETFELLVQRTMEKSITEDLRYNAWMRALEVFLEHPLLGTGVGYTLGFYQPLPDGTFAYLEVVPHNIYVQILYTTGILGFSLFAALHFLFLTIVWKNRRHVRREHAAIVAGLMAGYLSFLAILALQPIQTGQAVGLSLLMGLVLILVRKKEDAGAPLPSTTDGNGCPL